MTKLSYKDAGVDLNQADQALRGIVAHARGTHSENVLKGIGLFSGFYRLDTRRFRNPVLVSSIDGVGTKVKLAEMARVYDGIGKDLVNHCINDIAVCGAEPLFFMDYVATDKLQSDVVEGVVRGMALACKEANCALIAGETAEMPGVYQRGCFDVAGAIVGVVEEDGIIDGEKISPGDLLIGIASNGIHTNGYSLVRKILFETRNFGLSETIEVLGCSLGEELLRVHKNYLPLIRKIAGDPGVVGIAHITGGGIVGNTKRLLRENLTLRIDWNAWEWPPIFSFLQRQGQVSDEEMRQVFNLGVGLVLIVRKAAVETVLALCRAAGEEAFIIGSVNK